MNNPVFRLEDGTEVTVYSDHDWQQALKDRYPDVIRLYRTLTAEDICLFYKSGTVNGNAYMYADSIPPVTARPDWLQVTIDLRPEEYMNVLPDESNVYNPAIFNCLRERGEIDKALATMAMAADKDFSHVSAEVPVGLLPKVMTVEGVPLPDVLAVVIQHPEIGAEKMLTVLQMMDVCLHGADAVRPDRIFTAQVKNLVTLDFDEFRSKAGSGESEEDLRNIYDVSVRRQAELGLRRIQVIPTRPYSCIVRFLPGTDVQQQVDEFNQLFEAEDAADKAFAACITDSTGDKMAVSVYTESPLSQYVVSSRLMSMEGVDSIMKTDFFDIRKLGMHNIEVKDRDDHTQLMVGYIGNGPARGQRAGHTAYAFHEPLHELPYLSGNTQTADRHVWLQDREDGTPAVLWADGETARTVTKVQPVEDMIGMLLRKQQDESPLMHYMHENGIYFYQKDTLGFIYADRERNMLVNGEKLSAKNMAMVTDLVQNRNIIRFRGTEVSMFFNEPVQAEYRTLQHIKTGDVQTFAYERTLDGREYYTSDRKVLTDAETYNDITGRLTEAAVYGKPERMFVRCRIDGIQQPGSRLLLMDVDAVKNVAMADGNLTDWQERVPQAMRYQLAARYFQQELQTARAVDMDRQQTASKGFAF